MSEANIKSAPILVAVAGTVPHRGSLLRVVWRWHFYAGIVVAPVLITLAVTGGLYVFKDEIERALNADVVFVTPQESRLSLDEQVAAARASLPDGYRPASLDVNADPARSTIVHLQAPKQPNRRVGVNPYTCEALGTLHDNTFFPTVLAIHRNLFLGTTGRIVVELTTCWSIVLLLTGLYLWWPRRREKIRGVWLARLRAKPYTVLRDFHALSGAYLLPVATTIVATGLLYTLVWGAGYRYAGNKTGAFTTFTAFPKSPAVGGNKPLPVEDAVATARELYPGRSFSVTLPRRANDSYVFFVRGPSGPVTKGVLVLHNATGEVLSNRPAAEFPIVAWLATWNYSLHVGTPLGLTTKVLWLIAVAVLASLPVTGLWMWWQRRPRGHIGLPRRPAVRLPWWVVGSVLFLSAVLPTVGASIILILAVEWIVSPVGKWHQKRRGRHVCHMLTDHASEKSLPTVGASS
jgi:uncharacterized iron-regulated membrane protein